jgi:V8-like Glu-specific endopeptidase
MLNPDDLRTLHREIRQSFTFDEFRTLLAQRLGLRVELIVPKAADMGTQVFEVIQTAEQAGWTADLIRTVFDARPANAALARLYQSAGLGTEVVTAPPDPSGRPVHSSTAYLDLKFARHDDFKGFEAADVLPPDLVTARRRLTRIQARVCRVDLGGGPAGAGYLPAGTGFLVGPDTVLTAGHVLGFGSDSPRDPATVRCLFDYRHMEDGTVRGGTAVALATAGAVIRASPPDALNYVLLRLERPIGEERPDPVSPPRGWFQVPETDLAVPPGRTVVVPNYPRGEPLKLAFGSTAEPGPGAEPNRVWYRVFTAPGASGAPCLDENWQPFALHLGRVAQPDGPPSEIRQGVRIGAILADLRAADRAGTLGGPVPDEAAAAPDRGPPKPGPVVHDDDPQKDRWGGQSARAGRKLSAAVADASRRLFTCDFTVESTDGSPLEGPVVFHLHDSFPRMVIHVRRVQDGVRAVLEEVVAYGVFTVGAQVKDRHGNWIGLELDLAQHPDVPERFHDL